MLESCPSILSSSSRRLSMVARKATLECRIGPSTKAAAWSLELHTALRTSMAPETKAVSQIFGRHTGPTTKQMKQHDNMTSFNAFRNELHIIETSAIFSQAATRPTGCIQDHQEQPWDHMEQICYASRTATGKQNLESTHPSVCSRYICTTSGIGLDTN